MRSYQYFPTLSQLWQTIDDKGRKRKKNHSSREGGPCFETLHEVSVIFFYALLSGLRDFPSHDKPLLMIRDAKKKKLNPLGREANVWNTTRSFCHIFHAIKCTCALISTSRHVPICDKRLMIIRDANQRKNIPLEREANVLKHYTTQAITRTRINASRHFLSNDER
jgi:hypothetical protein